MPYWLTFSYWYSRYNVWLASYYVHQACNDFRRFCREMYNDHTPYTNEAIIEGCRRFLKKESPTGVKFYDQCLLNQELKDREP